MKSPRNLTGQKFGMLTCIEPGPRVYGNRTTWVCLCDCGNTCTKQTEHLKSALHCGCGFKKGNNFKHGHTVGQKPSKTYQCWCAMKRRCYNPACEDYENYGMKGVRVCDDWHTFENFLRDMGEAPEGLSIDRIDPFGNYEPGNCRWATVEQQAQNKRIHHTYILEN